ncbi:Sporulation kinase A [Novipirellula aureliae]|uniref:histidine kinase n=1 Tax=Novipirellula aureliae TaxID=2527966 RepID=A0A5C6DYV1_9BACT|nr:PAS domain-containing sensor histidine kinase [Novipirellula aureliae]TWU41414.1 Sporulation kinase A [Novipirellula aureliae]
MSFPKELCRNKDLLQLIVDASPAGLIIAGSQGDIQFVNPAASRMFGYESDELVGHPIECLLPNDYRTQHAQHVQDFLSHPKTRTMGSGHDLFGCRKDGSVFPADISLHPIHLDGKRFVLANVIDVTERRKQLTKSENRIRFLVENLPVGAVYLDHESLYFNPAVEALIGYKSHEIRSVQEWFDVLCCGNQAEAMAEYKAAKEEGFHKEWVQSIACKNTIRRELRIAGHQYDCHEVWLVADITELHDAQAKLVQAERLAAIGQMVTGLAHESRNALQRARGCLDLLELDLENKEEQLDLIVRIRRSLGDLQQNYEEVRQYAAPIILRRDVCHLSNLIELSFDNLLCEFATGKHRLIFEQRDEQDIVCDAHRMTHVFRNVIENAMAAKPSGVTIRVSITDATASDSKDSTPTMRRIEMSDDGAGMSGATLSKAFEPFFTTKQAGTGLGLAICQRILDAHGGTISIESFPSTGTTLVMALPMT